MIDRQISGALPLFVRECDEKIAKLEAELEAAQEEIRNQEAELKDYGICWEENQKLRDIINEIISTVEKDFPTFAAAIRKQALEVSDETTA